MAVQTFNPTDPTPSAPNWSVAQRLVDAFAPHAQTTPDMTVALDKGHLLNGATLTEVNPQTVGPFASPANRRVDRIVVDRDTGVASIVTGSDGSLVPPALPVGALPVARVVLTNSTVQITNEALFDERSFSDLSSSGSLNPTLGALGSLDATPGLVEQTGEAAFTKRPLGVATPASVPTRATADARYLQLTGGALTGALTLDGAPTAKLEAATKGYVDDTVQALDTRYLPLTGGALSGALALAGDPVAPSQAATKSYVDSVAQGFAVKTSVRAATVAPITLAGLPSVDGVAVAAGDRVLVKNQSAAQDNGLYKAAAGAWSRAADMTVWSQVPGAFTFVEEGAVNADTGWVSTADQGGTLGTTPIPWSQFSGVGAFAPVGRAVNTQHSLTGGGDLSANRTLSLVGDAASPGSLKYYGTDSDGARGFYALSTSASHDFVATGAIAAGKMVGLRSDGTVEAIVEVPQSAGSAVVFRSAYVGYTSCCYDSGSQKIVVAFWDGTNSNYGTAVVGTVSGTSIAFGTPVVFKSSYSLNTSCCFDANSQKVVIAFADNGNSYYGTAVVGTVSGTSISFGTPVVFKSSNISATSCCYDSVNKKVVIVFQDSTNSNGSAIVGTVSGTSISFGTPVVFKSNSVSNIASCYDSANAKIVITFRDDGNNNLGAAVVGTVSGTSISFGSWVNFMNGFVISTACCYDPINQKVVVASQNGSGYGVGVVGTVSGTSISFGTPVVFKSSSCGLTSCCYDANSQKIIIVFRDDGNSYYGTVVAGLVSGTAISFGMPVVFKSVNIGYPSCCYDPSSKRVVIAFQDGATAYGNVAVFSPTTTNISSFIGVAKSAASAGQTVSCTTFGGVNTNQSELVTGGEYYLATDGTLTTATTNKKVGRALSSTSIIFGGNA